MAPWQSIHKIATEQELPEVDALATIVKVEGMHRIADTFGPIPYVNYGSSSLYDALDLVYNKFFEELDNAIASEEITATVDPTIFASIMEKTSFSFSVSISNVTTNDKNTVISSSLSTLPVIINKAAYCNLKSGIPSNSQLISNRAGWIINVEEGVEGAPNNLIDGKTGTDVALNNKGFWFTVDLGEAKVLTGIKTNHWANAYAPREVEILQSENGTTWKS